MARKIDEAELDGAIAQEESLARASALYATIAPRPMYAFHAARHDPFYTDWMIWSPKVPVFRDDVAGHLLEEPYAATFLTAAAPMAFEVRRQLPSRAVELAPDFPENQLILVETWLMWKEKKTLQRDLDALAATLPKARQQLTGDDWVAYWDDWDRRWKAVQTKAAEMLKKR